jgi:hypothetical protein
LWTSALSRRRPALIGCLLGGIRRPGRRRCGPDIHQWRVIPHFGGQCACWGGEVTGRLRGANTALRMSCTS